MIINALTGDNIKPPNYLLMYNHDYCYFGNYLTDSIILICCHTGLVYEIIEIIRRIILRDIVGSDEDKQQQMNATVHIFYEIASVSEGLHRCCSHSVSRK